MSRPERMAAAGAVLALVAVAVVVLTRQAPDEVPAATGLLEIDVPRRHEAGSPMTVAVSGANPALDSAQVVVSATAGNVSLAVELRRGRGGFALESSITQSAGMVEVWVTAGLDQAAAVVEIDPGAPVEPIVPFVGPKSIVADGEDHSMVVAVVSDRYGNPVVSRAGALLTARQPGGRETSELVETTGLLVWRRVFSGTLAGRASITVSLGAIGGPVADLDEVAGRPVAIDVSTDRPSGVALRADGRRLHRLLTGPIVDRFGNVVTDGTAVTFRIDEPTGRRVVTAATIDGRAEVWVEAPDAPGVLRVVATSSGVDSEALTIEYAPAVDAIPTEVSELDGGWVIDVGPVRMIDGGWIPDGTEIALLVPGRPPLRSAAFDGRARLESTSALPDGAKVLVLGVEGPVA